MMIYTLTLNPALDRTILVNKLVFDDANRIVSEQRYAAGKGVDVSRVVMELGGDTLAFGFVGGYNGAELEDRLNRAGVPTDFTHISSETRTNIIVRDLESNSLTELNARGPQATQVEYEALLEKLRQYKFKPGFLAASGSVPPGVPTQVYQQVVAIANSKGLKAVVDADGELLRLAIEAGPFMIKPNLHELRRLLDRQLEEISDVVAAARMLRERGVEIVLVSLGQDGAVMACQEGSFLAKPPEVKAISPVGAGDSLVAGFVLGLDIGLSLCESLRLGVAAGAATALTPGTELCRYEDVYRLKREVSIEAVK